MLGKSSNSGICQRVEQVRRELHGNRGKVRFAKQLGISPSTYNYYETTRVPPAEVLVRIAGVSGVDLRWLLTGQESALAVPADHPAVARIAKLLAEHPDAAGPLTAFVDILAESLAWPKKAAPAAKKGGEEESLLSDDVAKPQAAAAEPRALAEPQAESAGQPRRDWIPVLGRSAAGVPAFWADAEDAAGVTVLAELVDRYAGRPGRRVVPAVAGGETGQCDRVAQIITLTAPEADNVAEFVVAGNLKREHSDAFAVRIDGDSMAPEIRHGDVVICSASQPAADGAAAVVQLAGQIGVTCKIFRRAGDAVHLIPINEQYPPQSFPADEVVWARRVLARLRPR